MLQKCFVCMSSDLNVHKYKIIFIILLFLGVILLLTFQLLPKGLLKVLLISILRRILLKVSTHRISSMLLRMK